MSRCSTLAVLLQLTTCCNVGGPDDPGLARPWLIQQMCCIGLVFCSSSTLLLFFFCFGVFIWNVLEAWLGFYLGGIPLLISIEDNTHLLKQSKPSKFWRDTSKPVKVLTRYVKTLQNTSKRLFWDLFIVFQLQFNPSKPVTVVTRCVKTRHGGDEMRQNPSKFWRDASKPVIRFTVPVETWHRLFCSSRSEWTICFPIDLIFVIRGVVLRSPRASGTH